jgi:hypothetical protein
VQHSGRGDFVDERHHGQAHPSLFPCFQPDFGQCAVDDFAKAHQAATEHRARAAVDGDRAPLQRVESENGGVQVVPELVRRVAETFGLLGGS